ncbi:V-type proton ATPase subunit E-like protein [Euroglyphus maynei]|uniref:V-type proton ATPase subunit E n=1 Tax=Euroglyphus maynei TaxID=6958 RepID=A0A1Y3AX95_EURMA|nr:V-type proton ATPase subunit E-like protein [Euroglyphus maynei]
MALGEADVQKQIKHMVAFINQEATEKAEEIEAKAEEEFNIEKGRLVQEQRLKIIEFFERKEKQVELKRRIYNSHLQNQSRLRILKQREELIRDILEEARQKLAEVTKDADLYKKVMQKLIAQAVFRLIEPEVVICCRKQDLTLVESLLDSVKKEYNAATKRNVTIKINKDRYLLPDTCGGIEMYAQGGKIKVTNTLESRLDLISRQLLPEIRVALFQRNPNRKFDD